jgi:hypothetical protein
LPPPSSPHAPAAEPSGAQSTPATLKGVADHHPLVVAIGLFLLGATVGALPLVWVKSKADDDLAHERRRVGDLEARISSVERSVGDGEDLVLRLDNMIIDASELDSVPQSADRVAGGDFYVTPPSDWEFDQEPFGANFDVTLLDPEVRDRMSETMMYSWTSSDEHLVEHESGVDRFYTRVGLARLPEDFFANLFAAAAAEAGQQVAIEPLLRLASEDPVGAMLQFVMVDYVSRSIETGIVPIVDRVQRTPQGMYVAVTLAFAGVTVNNERVDQFFAKQEWILLESRDGVVMVLTEAAAEDQRGLSGADSQQILESLRVVN